MSTLFPLKTINLSVRGALRADWYVPSKHHKVPWSSTISVLSIKPVDNPAPIKTPTSRVSRYFFITVTKQCFLYPHMQPPVGAVRGGTDYVDYLYCSTGFMCISARQFSQAKESGIPTKMVCWLMNRHLGHFHSISSVSSGGSITVIVPYAYRNNTIRNPPDTPQWDIAQKIYNLGN